MDNVTPFNNHANSVDISKSFPYQIREKLNNGISLSCDEKEYITSQCNANSYFKDSIPLMGWRIHFGDVLRTYVVRQYGQWQEYKAIDKTSLRSMLYGCVEKIVEVL